MLLEENKKKILIMGVICVTIVIGVAIYFFMQSEEEEFINFEDFENNVGNVENIENVVQDEIVEELEKIVVHISGQVANPGVISLDEGSRLIDAINLSGGLTSKADISKVNLAYILEDAQKIYIPSIEDKDEITYISEDSGNTGVVTSENGQTSTKKEEELMVNINTANEEQLEQLPGIGTSIATRIVNYRKENGKFNSIEDIKNVSGIGDAKFNKIKDNICIK